METTEYKCEICDKVSASKRAFRNHCFSKGHHQFQCGFCQKAFIIQQAKDDHERMKHAAPAIVPAGTLTDSGKASRGWDTYSILSESEQGKTYAALSLACHARQLLELQGYILPGSIRVDMREATVIPYTHFLEAPQPLYQSTSTVKRKAVTLHCEWVLVYIDRPTVALISAVDTLTGDVLLNAYVSPGGNKVSDWRTDITGINRSKMRRTERDKQTLSGWQDARHRLFSYIDSNTILVGHELQTSLAVLGIFHQRILDTRILTAQAAFGKNVSKFPITWGLEHISRTLFHEEMSAVDGYHNCLERTRVSREIALCVQVEVLLKSWGEKARNEYKCEQQIKSEMIKQSIDELLAEYRVTKTVKVGILIEGLDS